MTSDVTMPDIQVPAGMSRDEMPDLLRYWYLGTRARRHMVLRRFWEVDVELEPGNGRRCLDIGSAWGYNVMALSSLGMDVVGLDLIVDQFGAGQRIAAHNRIDFRVVGGNMAALPFGAEQFDDITMVETFEHVYDADRRGALAECFRVLRPGGRLVLSTPNYGSIVERFKRLAVKMPWLQQKMPTMCYPADDVDREHYHPYQYHRPLSPDAIRELLESAGFEVRHTKYFLFVLKNTPDWLYRLTRATETLLEATPGLRRLAATVCVTADKLS